MDLGYSSFTAELFGITRKALGRIEAVLDKIRELQNQTIQYQNYVGESEMVDLNAHSPVKKTD
jgi:threonyl-tRNA synthetase